MTAIITLTVGSTDTGPFNLYSNLDGYVTPFATGVPHASMVAGYTSSAVPDYTDYIRIKSTGNCTTYVDVPTALPPTTTSTTTPLPPVITTTTTTAALRNANFTFTNFTAACGNPLNAAAYQSLDGTQYFYDVELTRPVNSGSSYWRFNNIAIKTTTDGSSTGAFNCEDGLEIEL